MTVTLAFRPSTDGPHFRNAFQSNLAGGFPEVRLDGLCGGVALGAYDHFRYGMAIPPRTDADNAFSVSFEILRPVRAEEN
jgi:hypothetical protein